MLGADTEALHECREEEECNVMVGLSTQLPSLIGFPGKSETLTEDKKFILVKDIR